MTAVGCIRPATPADARAWLGLITRLAAWAHAHGLKWLKLTLMAHNTPGLGQYRK